MLSPFTYLLKGVTEMDEKALEAAAKTLCELDDPDCAWDYANDLFRAKFKWMTQQVIETYEKNLGPNISEIVRQNSNRIAAIKEVRVQTNWGLKESKDAVDAVWNEIYPESPIDTYGRTVYPTNKLCPDCKAPNSYSRAFCSYCGFRF